MECTLLFRIFLLLIPSITIHEIHAQGIPGQVQNLKVLETTPESIQIEWEPPVPQDPPITIEGYEVQIGDNPAVQISDVMYNFIGLKSCLNYDISVKAYSADSTGEAAPISAQTPAPSPMTDKPTGEKVEYEFDTHSMVLSWQPPQISEACITDYRINYYGTGGGTDTVTTTETSDTKNEPVACRDYTIDIIAKIGESTESQPTRVLFTTPGRATNPPVHDPPYVETWNSVTIKFTVDSASVNRCKLEKLHVECEALPEDNENAVNGTVWSAYGETELVGFPENSQPVTVSGMSEVTNYTCVGYVTNEIETSAASEEIKIMTKLGLPGQVQNLKVLETTPESIQIEWEPPVPQDPPITIEGYEVQIGDNPAVQISDVMYNFIGLKSCLNYDISVKAYSADSTGEAAPISAQTPAPSPMTDKPTGEKVEYEFDTHSMVLSWQPPQISEACITDYRINYYGTGGGTDTVTTTETSDTKNEPVACRDYTIDIIAKIGESTESQPTRVLFTTPGRATNPPVHDPPYVETWNSVTIKFTVDSASVNRCKLEKLHVECEALPEDNENAVNGTVWSAYGETELVGFPENSQPVTVSGMSEVTNYTCVGYVTNEIETSAASEEIKIMTKLGPPDPPEIIGITDVTATSFTVSWTDPINVPGSVTKFEVIVTPIRPEYLLPPDCDFEEDPIMIAVEPNIFEHNFAMAKPDYSYDVQVAIYNDVDSSTSNTVQTTTLTASSEAPRFGKIATEINEDAENYDVNINIEWLLPCLSNDDLLNHNIAISGVRPNYTPDAELQEIPIGDIMAEVHQYSFVPKPAFLYSISIREDSQDHKGQALDIADYLAPSGVPPTTSVTILPPSNDTDYPHSQARFQFGSDLFDNIMGDVLYYSIILGTPGNEEVSKWGYWNGTDWPDLGGWSDGNTVDPYEATPIEWNPFVGGNDEVEIVLGKDTCENEQPNCNGPLKPETDYTIKVRGYTSGGYKDTATVSFTTMVRLPPLIIEIIDETETSFLITWGEPTIPGTVQKFEVTVTKIQEEYLIPPGCEPDDQIKIFEVDPDVREYLFEEAIPFTTYEAVVAIINADGKFPSDPAQIITLSAASEPPRFINESTDINQETDAYNVAVKLEWSLPCLSNDNLLQHVISIRGERQDYVTDETLQEIPIEDFTIETFDYFFSPKPAYTYKISIREDSQDHEGELYEILDFSAPSGAYTYKISIREDSQDHEGELYEILDFSAPSGVPPSTTVTVPTPSNDTDSPHIQTVLKFEANLFDPELGDIIYYSIILGTPENEEAATWGYWDGENWPQLGGWNEAEFVEPYEATPVKWNPFSEDITTAAFTIGVAECENGQPNCNGALQPETEYTVKVRGFTSAGYRDRESVTFITQEVPETTEAPAPEGTTSEPADDDADPAVIWGSVGGILLILLIAGLIFLLWKKKVFNRCFKGKSEEVAY